MLKLISEGKLKANITNISFEEIGEGVQKLERGEVIGRLVAVRD